MLTDTEFVVDSLEQDLIISGLMIDHATILEIILKEENIPLFELYKIEKEDYQIFYDKVYKFADRKVSSDFVNTNTVITEYTKTLEERIRNSYDIDFFEVDFNISENDNYEAIDEDVNIVNNMNIEILNLLNNSLINLNNVDAEIHNKNLFLNDEYIRHFREETNMFIYIIETISNYISSTPNYAYTLTFDSNSYSQDHVLFLKNLISNNGKLLKVFDDYNNAYSQLLNKFDNNIDPVIMNYLLDESYNITDQFKNLTRYLTKLGISDDVSNVLVLIILDHFIKESNYMLLLNRISKIKQ